MNIKTLLKKTILSRHKIKPFNIDDAKVVILGTFPGEESLKHNKYYSNPTNQFWKILGIEFGNFKALKDKGIGLWDALTKKVASGCCTNNASKLKIWRSAD